MMEKLKNKSEHELLYGRGDKVPISFAMTAGKGTAAKLPNKNRRERQYAMKHFLVAIFALTTSFALFAQTTPRPAAHSSGRPASGAAAPGLKLPPGVPPGHGLVKTAFSLRYQDLRVGT